MFAIAWTTNVDAQTSSEQPAPVIVETDAAGTTTLEAGVFVPVVLRETIRSEDGEVAAAGAQFYVANDVRAADGRIRIKAGTSVEANVEARAARRIGRPGWIRIALLATTTVDGRRVMLIHQELEQEGQSKRGLAIGLSVGMVFVYPPLNLLHLLQRGRNTHIPGGTQFSARAVP